MNIEKKTHVSISFVSMLNIIAEAIEDKLNLPRGKIVGKDLTVDPAGAKGFTLSYDLHDDGTSK